MVIASCSFLGHCTVPRVLRCRARGRQPAAGWWPVAGHLCIQRSDRCAVLEEDPNGIREAQRVQIGRIRPLLEKPVTNRDSRGPGIVLHFGLCPAVTRGAHSRHERFERGRLPRIVYSMARILCPQTPDTFPSFERLRGTGSRLQSNRRSVAVQSHSAWWACSDQCGAPARCRPSSPAFPWDGSGTVRGRGAGKVRTPLPR